MKRFQPSQTGTKPHWDVSGRGCGIAEGCAGALARTNADEAGEFEVSSMLTQPLLTVREVAEMLKLKESTIRQMIASGRLRAIKFGREWRVIPQDLEACLQAHATRLT
jgi:excisionase family DNA binding protein